jgi:hypothetical protein
MEKQYVIHWRSRENGRTGAGRTLFTKMEAEKLAAALNVDHPEIEHEARNATEIVEPAGLDG